MAVGTELVRWRLLGSCKGEVGKSLLIWVWTHKTLLLSLCWWQDSLQGYNFKCSTGEFPQSACILLDGWPWLSETLSTVSRIGFISPSGLLSFPFCSQMWAGKAEASLFSFILQLLNNIKNLKNARKNVHEDSLTFSPGHSPIFKLISFAGYR
jgi:hypothetical protein